MNKVINKLKRIIELKSLKDEKDKLLYEKRNLENDKEIAYLCDNFLNTRLYKEFLTYIDEDYLTMLHNNLLEKKINQEEYISAYRAIENISQWFMRKALMKEKIEEELEKINYLLNKEENYNE
ncbi:MAG: hypothetical protein QXJ06_00565 [Candidatus Aenigmatarchaeota archaeon]